MTSTYFEGAYSDSQLIQYGYSRDQRPDTKQLNIGLTTLQDGLPLAFRVLVGHTADQTTPRQNLEAVQQLLLLAAAPTTDLTSVHDRGMATAETLVWYARRGQRFIRPVSADSDLQAVLDAVPSAELLAHPLTYHPQRAASDAGPGYYGVWRDHTVPFDGHSAQLRVLVVHSASKARLDAEKRQENLAKLQQRLAAIQTHLNQRKYKRRDYTWEQIHLAQRGNPAQDLLDITLQGEEGALELTCQVNAERLA